MSCNYADFLPVDFTTIKTAGARNLYRLARYIAKINNGERLRQNDCYITESPAVLLTLRRLNVEYEETPGEYANLLYFKPHHAQNIYDALISPYIVKNGRVYEWHHLAITNRYHAIRDGIKWEEYEGRFGKGLKAHIPSRWSGNSSRSHGIEYWIEA